MLTSQSDEASVYGTALFDALDLHLIHLEERLCNEVLFQLIDQVVDQQTIDGAERVFSYVERRISRIYVRTSMDRAHDDRRPTGR